MGLAVPLGLGRFGNGVGGQRQAVFDGRSRGLAIRQLRGGELSVLQPTRDLLLHLIKGTFDRLVKSLKRGV